MIEAASGIAPLFDPYNVRDLCDKLNSLIYGDSLVLYQESLAAYRPVSWINSAKEFYSKLTSMYASSVRDGDQQAVPTLQPLVAKTVDKSPNIQRFVPSRNKVCLDFMPCWRPLSPEGLLAPLTGRPWIHLFAGCEFLIIKARLTNLAEQSDHPIIAVFDECGQLLSTKSSATLLPCGDCIVYACIDQSRSNEATRRITVVFLDINADLAGTDLDSASKIPASIASPGWFSIHHIDIVSQ
jgi:hypothetical protein